MILTDYYLMQELKQTKSNRIDCVYSTKSYEPFETIARRSRNGKFYCYVVDAPNILKTTENKRYGDKSITNGKNISNIKIPNLDFPLYGYGDTKGTQDALLFIFNDDYKTLEIFVARGLKNNQFGLWQRLIDGDLDEEMTNLRNIAIPRQDKP